MKIFASYRTSGFFWFRVFGYGIVGKNVNQHRLWFSERNGYVRRLQIGSWSFKTITPNAT